MGANIQKMDQHFGDNEFGLPIILIIHIFPLDTNLSDKIII